jgi:hypothetical protein
MKAARKRATYWLTVEQIAALRREALRRAVEANTTKADASAILREVVAAWLAKKEGARR